ncbi:MAG: hypothetical protein HY854_06535 [Burkholderiales bacterium]|nr:hypothetical protein [Burkholderiales bacterium]
MSNPFLEQALQKIRQLREDLRVAAAELHLAHEAFQSHLPVAVRRGDVAWAIGQNAAVEHKLKQLAEELERVAELLRSPHYLKP